MCQQGAHGSKDGSLEKRDEDILEIALLRPYVALEEDGKLLQDTGLAL